MPKPAVLEGWASQVPESFVLALKASRRITHVKKLRETPDHVGDLYRVAATLAQRRGPVLFQLPPYLRKDVPLLRDFLAALPDDHRATVEVRHPSWLDDELYDALAAAHVALCVTDAGEEFDAPLRATSSFGYLRLRRRDYDEKALVSWAERVAQQPWERVFVYFKHEDEGIGPALAARFRSLFVDGRSLALPPARASSAEAPAATPARRRTSTASPT